MNQRAFPGVYKTPEYSTTLPLSKTKIVYRPYNVGDERNLVAAVSSKDTDPDFYIRNTLNVIQGVVLSDVAINKLPAIDVRFLLLAMRAKSVGEVIEFKYEDKKVEANILDFYIDNQREKSDYNIDIGGGIGIQMQDLSFEDEIRASSFTETDSMKADVFYKIMFNSIKAIYSTEQDQTVWIVGQDITTEQAEEFIRSIPGDFSRKIYEFIQNMPSLAVDITINGEKTKITDRQVDFLSSAQDT